ncbi:MAG: DEAD/DEAH box helicase [Dehalococcoidia bacterium]|nr:DEAD/DEAH box helicase [Dehalococcoidia bacterium]
MEVQAGPFERDKTFGTVSVSAPIRRALDEMGYEEPTPIQVEAIPVMFEGRDVVGRAQTGTGKTTAFGIPMIELLDPTRREVQGIVLAPTRELAVQVTGELRRLAKHRGIKVVTLYGGQKIDLQLRALRETPQIIVGTPGRVQDHMQRGTLKLNSVRIAVLDEADQMLDIGFAEDMIRILRATPRARQTALFSATVPFFIRRMIERFLRDPVHIGIGEESEAADTIEQVYYEVASQDKMAGLEEVLQTELEGEKVLIFCRTQVGVDRLARRLQRARIRVEPIHGGMRQNQREAVMRAFRSGDLKVLVATNVASRGLDIPEISHVINYDMPGNLEEYIHRIGRTGRIGNAGKAVTFVGEDDFSMLQTIKEHVGDVLTKGRLSLYAY